jgi:hypothetical protein
MHNEYAIEPAAVVTWEDLCFLSDHTGYERGRLVAEIPQAWRSQVFKCCKCAGELGALKVTERLNQMTEAGVFVRKPTVAQWPGHADWHSYAYAHEAEDTFDGIICQNPPPDATRVRTMSAIRETGASDPVWERPPSMRIDRHVDAFRVIASKLLRYSSEILFVDRYFCLEGGFLKVLEALIMEVFRNSTRAVPVKRIEYHFVDKSEHASPSLICKQCTKIASRIPKNASIVFVRWRQGMKPNGFHDRYILSERGGIGVGQGLTAGEGKTSVWRISERERMELWSEFSSWRANPGECLYDEIPTQVQGTRNAESSQFTRPKPR